MQRISWLPLIAGFLLMGVLDSCKNKTDYQIPLDYNIYNNETTVKASFYGQVLDESGKPVNKAQVSIGTNYTQTDTNGVFLFKLINTPSHNTTIRVAKTDYVTGFRSMMVENGASHEARFTLLSNSVMKPFVASAGGTLTFGNDLKITFPAKATIQQSNGLPYEGNVYVYARSINPNNEAGRNSMPGDLRSLRANMAEQAAYNYGMLHVAMFDEAGNALALAPRIDAQVYRSPAAAQMAGAPGSCMLSHFDEVLGIWREKSAAVLQGGMYLGPIHDMGYYMVHSNDDAIPLEATLLDANNTALPGYVVKFVNTVRNDHRVCLSNSNGKISLLVPTNTTLEMQVYSANYSCGTTPLYTQTVNTSGLPAQLGTVIVGGSLLNTGVSGSLIDCSNKPVENGFVLATPKNVFIPANASGNFSYTFPCDAGVPTTFIAYNPTNRNYTVSPVFNLNSSMNNPLGNLFACNYTTPFIDVTLTNMVTLASANRTFTFPVDTIRASVDLINGGSILSGFNGNNMIVIQAADTVNGVINATGAGFDGIGNFSDNQFVFVSGTVTYNSFPFFPGHVLGEFNLFFTGLPSNHSYIATGKFRMPRSN